MTKEEILNVHTLWIFVVLSLLVGGTLGYIIGVSIEYTSPTGQAQGGYHTMIGPCRNNDDCYSGQCCVGHVCQTCNTTYTLETY